MPGGIPPANMGGPPGPGGDIADGGAIVGGAA